jgi:branched-chain amino acid transport system permease protein
VTSRFDLSRGSPTRTLLYAVGAGVGLFLITQVVLPGTAAPARGTPYAILFNGLVQGALNAFTAIGIVLIYRTSRVINFAQAALGAVGAIFAYNLIIVYRWPYGLALATGVLVSALVAVFIELLILRRFFEAPRLVLTILTVGLGSLLALFAVGSVATLPIWGQARDLAATFGAGSVNPVPSIDFRIGDTAIPFSFAHLLTLGLLLVTLLVVAWFLKYTRLGTAIRASSENAERAELLGVNVRILQTIVWLMAGGLSAVGLTLLGTTQTFALGSRGAPGVLIAALAAALIARMRSISVAVYASLLIAVGQAAVGWSYRDQSGLIEAGLFVVILLALLAQRRTLQRGEEGTSWEANQEIRPTPRELIEASSVRTWRRVFILVAGVFLLAFPWTVEPGLMNRASLAAIFAMVLMSLVVLTGWAGQVSLGQFGLVAVGAMAGGALTSRADISFWFALPIGAIVCAVVALIVGLPALRIRGLFLAVVTLAFASAVSLLLFDERYFGWLEPENIRRPTLLFLDFEDERSMYYLSILFLALVIFVIASLRRSRPGRVLIAMRENENDLQAMGINVVRTKLSAFALSGFLCGLAGVLFAHHQRAVSETAFTPQASIDVLVYGIIGGIGSVTGGLLGSALQSVIDLFPLSDPILQFFANQQFLVIIVLFLAPGGLAAMFYAMRDSIYRIVAQRQQIVVPSLMADYDPAVIERQLIPLGEAEDDPGVAAIESGASYRLESGLYTKADGERGRLRAPDDSSALTAAAQRAAGED